MEGTVISSTLTTPRTPAKKLIGLNVAESIQQPDRSRFKAALKHIITDHTPEFITYRVGSQPYISIMVPHDDIIVIAEIPDILPDSDRQKDILSSSVRGLIKPPVTA